jgi:carnitine O-acetyltransferase
MAHLLLHGLSSAVSDKPINRWFDKSLQYIVTQNGKAGLTGEHSMMDGMPVVTLADKLATVSYQDCMDQASIASDNVAPYADFVLPPTAQPHPDVKHHRRTFEDWVGQHEIHPFRFAAYGSDWIKKQAQTSPDAYVQMAMQIATYRLWNGEQGGTYEATQVRPFLHGRTETTRSVSTQSAELVHRFGIHPAWHEMGDAVARAEKLQLLQDAAKAHVNYIKLAGQAQGVDRHFLGLALSIENGETAPDLFADAVFQRSKTWRVSTSNLSHPRFVNWGYGEVVPNGVGLSYSIQPHYLQFSVTALKKHGWTERLVQHLDEALMELQALVEAEGAGTPSSKL